MKKILTYLIISSCLCQAQSTFTFGTSPQNQQYYPANNVPMQRGYPMQQRYPTQQRYPIQQGGGIPLPMGGGGGNIMGIIGLVAGLAQMAATAEHQKKIQQQALATSSEDSQLYNIDTSAGSEEEPCAVVKTVHTKDSQEQSVYHKISEQQTPTGTRTLYASGPFDKTVNGIPNGIVQVDGNIKSPYSDFIIDIMKYPGVQPGHIITDPNTKKNFRIPGINKE
jgi:hypothetical protein